MGSTMFFVYKLTIFLMTLKCVHTTRMIDNLINGEDCEPAVNSIACDKFSSEDYPSPLNPNHKCHDYVKQDRGDQSYPLEIIKKGLEHEKQLFGEFKETHFRTLRYVNGSRGEEFLLCAMPKNGVTRTKLLIMRINGVRGKVHHQANHPVLENMDGGERMRLLNDSNIIRIKLVRNPYIRAISMYNDKILQLEKNKEGFYEGFQMKFDKFPSFDDWVAQLFYDFQHHRKVNSHFRRQYSMCWEDIGLKFDYVLKIERFDFWYPCFVENFDLWRYVMKGWPDEKNCYFSSKDVPCNGPYQAKDGRLIYEEGQEDGVKLGHRHDSILKLREFYKNETTATKITQIYLDDIVQYSYPFWMNYMRGQQ